MEAWCVSKVRQSLTNHKYNGQSLVGSTSFFHHRHLPSHCTFLLVWTMEHSILSSSTNDPSNHQKTNPFQRTIGHCIYVSLMIGPFFVFRLLLPLSRPVFVLVLGMENGKWDIDSIAGRVVKVVTREQHRRGMFDIIKKASLSCHCNRWGSMLWLQGWYIWVLELIYDINTTELRPNSMDHTSTE